jgi:hypothetical protein
MKDFSRRFPGLSEEQIRIRKKIWDREQDLEKKLFEAKKGKGYRLWDGDDDEGFYADLQYDVIYRGTVSDGPLRDSTITFLFEDGRKTTTTSNTAGKFTIPGDFFHGDIVARGGIDTITGHNYIGEFSVDAEFFLRYTAITPFVHVANYVWLNTPTQTAYEAMEQSMRNIHKLTGVSFPVIETERIFNDDHVKMTVIGEHGAKELQIINMIFEAYSDILSHTYAKDSSEVLVYKKRAYELLGKKLLDSIYGKSTNFFDFNLGDLKKDHEECCCLLVEKALNHIRECSNKSTYEISKDLQSLNSIIKSDWSKFTLMMTEDEDLSTQKMWDHINRKSIEDVQVDLSFTHR